MEVFNGHQPCDHDLLVLHIWENTKINDGLTEDYELCSTQLRLQSDSNPSALHTEACSRASNFWESKKQQEDYGGNFGKRHREEVVNNIRAQGIELGCQDG